MNLADSNSEVANDPWSNTLEEYLDFLLGWVGPGRPGAQSRQSQSRYRLLHLRIWYKYKRRIHNRTFPNNLYLLPDLSISRSTFRPPASPSTTATITARPDNDDTYYYLGFITKMNLTMNSMAIEEHVVNNASFPLQCAWLHQGAPPRPDTDNT